MISVETKERSVAEMMMQFVLKYGPARSDRPKKTHSPLPPLFIPQITTA